MKILWLSTDIHNRANFNMFHPLKDEISKLVDLNVIYKDLKGHGLGPYWTAMQRGKVNSVVMPNNVNSYNFIMTDFPYLFQNENWRNVRIPKGALIEDVHSRNVGVINWLYNNGFSVIFVRYKQAFIKKHGSRKIKWLPHSIPSDYYYDYKLEKKYDALLTGQVDSMYPLRQEIAKRFKDKPYFTYIKHPGKHFPGKIPEDAWPVGRDYCKVLNSSRIAFTDCAKVKYPIHKYMEIPGCRAALFAEWTGELGKLGYIPNENMIPITAGNMIEKTENWLKPENRDKLEELTQKGYEMVHSKHTAKIRAAQFVDMVSDTLKGR
jgi:hypothetical protein